MTQEDMDYYLLPGPLPVPHMRKLAMARSGRVDFDTLFEASQAVHIWRLTNVLRRRQERLQ